MDTPETYKSTVYQIIGDAFSVYNEYNGGLMESAYEAALCYLMGAEGLKVERQKLLPIYFKGIQLEQTYRMDVVVNDHILLELKACNEIIKEHRFQLFNYLRLTHIAIGLLINFSISNGVQCEKYYYNETTNECKPF